MNTMTTWYGSKDVRKPSMYVNFITFQDIAKDFHNFFFFFFFEAFYSSVKKVVIKLVFAIQCLDGEIKKVLVVVSSKIYPK